MKKFVALLLVAMVAAFFIGYMLTPCVSAGESDTQPVNGGTSFAEATGTKILPYVGIGIFILLPGVIMFVRIRRKKAGESTKMGPVLQEVANGGVEDFINAGKELLDKEWREAKEAVGDGLDDIDKKWDEGLALLQKTAERMTEKQNK